jgi:outer membrane protein OmpA-like peptidoglycan-associated protein
MLHFFKYLLLSLSLLLTFALGAQEEEGLIFLRNASFEDMPRNSAAPSGWTNCGAPGETPPDIHPDPEFAFKVGMTAQHGNTFLGMVTRDTETWESIGQQLTERMVADQCYQFDIQLARSRVYFSMSRITRQPTNYVTPIRLRIWGGYSVCDKVQLLGESALVANYDWAPYRLKLSPKADFTHLILEAYYPEAILLPINGNILLDNAQPFRPIECDQPLMMYSYNETIPTTIPEDEIVVTKLPMPGGAKGPVVNILTPPKPKLPVVRLGNTEAILEKGAVFSVENITFKANSADLEVESESALQEIVGFLKKNENVIVEIGGHASRMAGDFYAADLSENRAKKVVDYLKAHSIGFERLLAYGYGKTRPVCMENTKDCNRKNQRVEVKIMKINRTK